jgi:hypothetical protein
LGVKPYANSNSLRADTIAPRTVTFRQTRKMKALAPDGKGALTATAPDSKSHSWALAYGELRLGSSPRVQGGGCWDHWCAAGADGVDDLGVVDALEVDPAPRGAMRKEMTDDNISSVLAGMPALG